MDKEQHRGYPQKPSAGRSCSLFASPFTRVPATGLVKGQHPVAIEEKALVHKKRRALLLRLCIYKDLRRITRQQGRAGFGRQRPFRGRKRGGSGEIGRLAIFLGAEYAGSAWADRQKYVQNRPEAACVAPRPCPCRARRGALWPNLQEPCSRASPESSQTRLGSQRQGADSGAGGPSEASK